jgi:hypothetical protein
LVDTVDESKNDFEDWGLWWLLLGYSHAADLLNPISDLRLLSILSLPKLGGISYGSTYNLITNCFKLGDVLPQSS